MHYTYVAVGSGPNEEAATDGDDSGRPQRKCLDSKLTLRFVYRASWIVSFTAALLIALLLLLLWHPWYPSDLALPPAQCGNSPTEAMEAGCRFDLMSFTWSRPQCFDGELVDEFLALQNWTWWLDAYGNQEVPLETVALGVYSPLFVTWEYHLFHCTYMWRKMHRAVLNGAPLDSYVLNLDHTLHCGHMLLNRTAQLQERNTAIITKYPSCVES
ncbi:hypothetical protein PT974_05015 [Cladobotryum mycophilum]|uniref:Uncharacterized protein n=1 Tax=Cladobotryum mycophilum TaxID=491253 RepID=A0ABR0SQT7_9HYPO